MKKTTGWIILYVGIVCGLALFVMRFDFLVSYLKVPFVPGYDTTGHAEVGKYYAQHIFPAAWGWAPYWLGGLPFPQFYPPLFYMVVAGFNTILPFSYELTFKLVIVVLTLAIPGLITLVMSRLSTRTSTLWLTGIISVLLLFIPFGKYDNLGVSMGSTFVVGLVTNLLSFVCFLIWLWAFLGSYTSKKSYILSIIFLACTALSSVHLLPVVACIFLAQFIVKEFRFFTHPHVYLTSSWARTRALRYYVLPVAVGITLTAFWLVPMLATFAYMPSQSLGLFNGIGARSIFQVVVTWWPIEIVLIITTGLLLIRRSSTALIICLATWLSLLCVVLPLDALFTRLPFHSYRILPYIYFSGAFFAAFIFDVLVAKFRAIYEPFIVAMLCFLFAFSVVNNKPSNFNFAGLYQALKGDGSAAVAEYMKDKKGMYAVEALGNARFVNSMIEAKSNGGLRSNYTVFSESSLSALFQTPFRTNITNHGRELLAVHSLLNNDQNFLNDKDPEHVALRARQLGISYLIVQSPDTKKNLDQSDAFVLEKKLASWSVYKLHDAVPDAYVAMNPTLVVAPIGIKGTTSNTPTFMLFSERAFMLDRHDMTFARASSAYIDDLSLSELNQFPQLILGTYAYHNELKAIDLISMYAKNHTVYAFSSPDSIYTNLQLALAGNTRVHFIETNIQPQMNDQAVYKTLQRFTDTVIQSMPEEGDATSTVALTTTDTTLAVHAIGSTTQPVLINTSYFPAWKRTDGEPVYLASPSYILTFVQGDTTITFTTPWYVYVGYGISGVALGLIVIMGVQGKGIKRRR